MNTTRVGPIETQFEPTSSTAFLGTLIKGESFLTPIELERVKFSKVYLLQHFQKKSKRDQDRREKATQHSNVVKDSLQFKCWSIRLDHGVKVFAI